MTTTSLTAALRACASGIHALEAGTELLIANGTFLRRSDFTGRFVLHGQNDGLAAIDWETAITALTSGGLSPDLGKGIGLAYLPRALAAPGTALALDLRGREVPARVVALPFVAASRRRP